MPKRPGPSAQEGRPLRILAVASEGGHWMQLRQLRRAFAGHDCAYVSTNADYAAEVEGSRFYTLPDANRWQRWKMLYLVWRAALLVVRDRPDAVVTTGAAPGLLVLIFARMLGARTVWIDSIANAAQLSVSGRCARRFASLWLTQWPELEQPGGPRYLGSVL